MGAHVALRAWCCDFFFIFVSSVALSPAHSDITFVVTHFIASPGRQNEINDSPFLFTAKGTIPYVFAGFLFLSIWLSICKVNSQQLLGVLGYNALNDNLFLTLLLMKKKKGWVTKEVIKLRPNLVQTKHYLVLKSWESELQRSGGKEMLSSSLAIVWLLP